MLVQETDIVRSTSVADMIQQRASVMDALARVATDSDLIDRTAGNLSILLPHVNFGDRSNRFYGTAVSEEMRAQVDATFWNKLMQDSGAWSFLDAKRRAEWRKMIEGASRGDRVKSESIPVFDGPTIEATFLKLHSERANMVIDGVCQVFRELSWEYKTNRPVEFGPKIIVSGCAGWSYCRADKIDDLSRILHVFDGKPEPDHRETFSRKIGVAGGSKIELSDDYLRVVRFKNGNAHVWFKDGAHVKQLNKIIAQRYPDCLPAARGN